MPIKNSTDTLLVRLCTISLALTFAAVSLIAQERLVRSMHGTVTDEDGRPIRDAVVQIENTRTLQIRSYRTGTDGHYMFRQLSTDIDYRLSAQYKTHRSGTKLLTRFDSSPDAAVDLTIHLGG